MEIDIAPLVQIARRISEIGYFCRIAQLADAREARLLLGFDEV